MKYLSLLEKLKVLYEVLLSYKFIFCLIIIMLFFTILYLCKKISNKKYILFIVLSLIITFGICIIKNYKILSNTFDDFMTIFMTGIYFPSIYIYIGVLIIILLAFITSIISSKRKIYKIINSISFVINSIFLIIILNIISDNNINVFQISSLYTNNVLVAILELNMLLFIIWLSSLAVAYITNAICDKLTLKKPVTKEIIVENINEETITNEIKEEVLTNEVIISKEELTNEIEDNKEETIINEIEAENDDSTITTEVTEATSVIEDKVTFNDILNGLLPVTYYNNDNNTISYNIVNPQEIYENNYNNLKLELEQNEMPKVSIKPETRIKPEVIITKPEVKAVVKKKNDTIENITKKIKEENMKKNLISNTISLNDLIKQDEEINIVDEVITSVNNPNYTLEDYKKIAMMLKEIKNSSSRNNISIDDAVTMSLIGNYSIDDCVKFKEILESNLN